VLILLSNLLRQRTTCLRLRHMKPGRQTPVVCCVILVARNRTFALTKCWKLNCLRSLNVLRTRPLA